MGRKDARVKSATVLGRPPCCRLWFRYLLLKYTPRTLKTGLFFVEIATANLRWAALTLSVYLYFVCTQTHGEPVRKRQYDCLEIPYLGNVHKKLKHHQGKGLQCLLINTPRIRNYYVMLSLPLCHCFSLG